MLSFLGANTIKEKAHRKVCHQKAHVILIRLNGRFSCFFGLVDCDEIVVSQMTHKNQDTIFITHTLKVE